MKYILLLAIVIAILCGLFAFYKYRSKDNYYYSHCQVYKKWSEIPKFVPRKRESKTRSFIPKQIFQTNEKYVLPGMRNAIKGWIQLNPEYDYNYYTTEECRDFIKNEFDENVLNAYDTLLPGAYKADLWRYCILYKYGGVYADSCMVALKPLNSYISDSDKFVTPIDYDKYCINTVGLYNAFMAAEPRHPILKIAINLVVQRVENRDYGDSALYPTGPKLLADALCDYMNMPRNINLSPGIAPSGIKLIYRCTKFMENTGHVYDITGTKLIAMKYRCHESEKNMWLKTLHYPVAWKSGKVFAELPRIMV